MEGDQQTYTQRLAREIDSAFGEYKPGEAESEARQYEAFKAQARDVLWYRLRWDLRDDEVWHDIATRAMMRLDQFRGDCKASTWFYGIAQNEVNRALRRHIQERNRRAPLEYDEFDRGEDDVERENQFVAKPEDQDARMDVEKLMHGLPADQAEVVRLQLEGVSLQEIANSMGKPIGTVRGRARLAKEKMRTRAWEKYSA